MRTHAQATSTGTTPVTQGRAVGKAVVTSDSYRRDVINPTPVGNGPVNAFARRSSTDSPVSALIVDGNEPLKALQQNHMYVNDVNPEMVDGRLPDSWLSCSSMYLPR